MGRVLRVGLTGGSATGKSTVAAMLAELGAEVVDADHIARRLLEPGTPSFRETIDRFGRSILAPDGRIDRARLARLIFTVPEKRQALESILHPRIREEEERRAEDIRRRSGAGIVITDAALLVETGAYRRYDRLVVVTCSESTQLRRLTDDKGLTREEAEKRIAAQLPNREKIRVADYRLDTDRPIEETRLQVRELFSQLKKILENDPVKK